MNQDRFDEMIRETVPMVTISDARVDALVDRTLGALPARMARKPKRWTILFPTLRYALPMAAALAIAFIVDGQYDQDLPVAQFSDLLTSNAMFSWGS